MYEQNGWRVIRFGAAHTYIAHIREYPPYEGLFVDGIIDMKWPKHSWEEGEIGGKSREEGEIGSKSREKGDLTPCSNPLPNGGEKRIELAQFLTFVYVLYKSLHTFSKVTVKIKTAIYIYSNVEGSGT